MPGGQRLPIPPIILAELGSDPNKPTVCFYGHLDVQPAKREDGWHTDPYSLTEVDGEWPVFLSTQLMVAGLTAGQQ